LTAVCCDHYCHCCAYYGAYGDYVVYDRAHNTALVQYNKDHKAHNKVDYSMVASMDYNNVVVHMGH
jgi:hypothetical protein